VRPKLQNKNGEKMDGINKGTNGVNCRMCESEKNVKLREVNNEEGTKEKITLYLCDECVKRLSVLEGLIKDGH
jgi:uncharacterized protein YlaI